jgi:magnesium-protoporphyrin O-methyltransferase
MAGVTYASRRAELLTYFDRTAADAWARLTSDAPVSRIRATVRAGRDDMRATLLSWLPDDLRGRRLLDAGSGTGALALEAARRGADVVAVDLSPTLVDLARSRGGSVPGGGSVTFVVGDMLAPDLGEFDHVVAMDSLIHYPVGEVARAVGELARRARGSVLFTFAPRTPALTVMHAVGRLFPRGDRAPAIEPASLGAITRRLAASADFAGWRVGRTRRVARGFYISQALEVLRG